LRITLAVGGTRDVFVCEHMPYAVLGNVSLSDCPAVCMADCLCATVLLNTNDGTCTKQQLP
jgi:hypothetical protein